MTAPGGCTSNWGTLLSLVQTARTNDGNQAGFFYYGLVAAGTPVGAVGGCEGGTAAGFDGAGVTLAHELGHGLGRAHAPCGAVGNFDAGYPFYEPYDNPPPALGMLRTSASIGEYGLDIRDGTIRDPAMRHDFMSYCGPPWISIRGHMVSISAGLLGAPVGAPVATEAAGAMVATSSEPVDTVSVIGTIGADGSFSVNSVARVSVSRDLPGWPPIATVAELLDEAGRSLAVAPLLVRTLVANCGCSGAGGGDVSTGGQARGRVFQAFLAPSTGAVLLRLRTGDETHWDRRAPASSPRVSIKECTLDKKHRVRLAWSAEVAADAQAEIWIQVSADGSHWRSAATQISGSKISFALHDLPPGRIMFRVLLHDGFSTAEATSPFVDLPARHGSIAILHPIDGALLDPDVPGLAWAAAYDATGEVAPSDRVTWRLDGEVIGVGVQIPIPRIEGREKVTLQAEYEEAREAITLQVAAKNSSR